jgi:hypothetical protein
MLELNNYEESVRTVISLLLNHARWSGCDHFEGSKPTVTWEDRVRSCKADR